MAGPESTKSDHEQSRTAPRTSLELEAVGAGAYIVDEEGRIVAVNSRAEHLLARSAEDLVGQDAHELLHRGPQGQPLTATQCGMRQAFHAGRPAQSAEDYFARGDDSLLPVSWMITPYQVRDHESGTLVIFHSAGQARAAGPRQEHAAETLTDFERLALLAETTTQLTSTLDVDEALRRLVGLVVPRLADWAVIDLITERDEVWRTAVVQADGDGLVYHEDLQGRCHPYRRAAPCRCPGPCAVSRPPWPAPRPTSRPRIPASRSSNAVCSRPRASVQRPSPRSAAPVPSSGPSPWDAPPSRGTSPSRPSLFEDIARRAGLALDNARLYQRQRAVAETMQNHLLPQMPRVPGLEMTVRYLPAPDASQVGGDWYDAFTLSDSATALAVGTSWATIWRPPPGWPSCATCSVRTPGRSESPAAGSWNVSTRRSCPSPTSPWPP